MTLKLYPVAEVAEICHVKPETVRTWIRDKKIPAVKPGREYLIDEEDLRAFLREQHG